MDYSQKSPTPFNRAARRFSYFILVIGSSLWAAWMMLEILRPNGFSVLEAMLLLLFSVTFAWVVTAFWSAAIGFVLQLFQLDPYSLRRQTTPRIPAPLSLQSRTAVIMPVYNEDTERTFCGFESHIRALASTGHFRAFDFFMLSDTQNPSLIDAEKHAWFQLQRRLSQLAHRVYYRRRDNNRGRKVGNIADFCQRWGSDYDFMIVLDADSLMTGACMINLATRMEHSPRAGLIQTMPLPVRQNSFFGRFIQFAASLYGPLLANGFAFWQTDNCNYWGHNAIIRVNAFMQCCGLPSLKGRAPFGGEILSHDFVEAALLYRGGWGVYLATDIDGSFEEVPGNIIDFAKRDRRWVQGNLQHLALTTSPGLSLVSRLHFLFGALAYLSSLFWLIMLAFSTADALLRAATADIFFSRNYQLFPDWPVAKTDFILTLLYLTIIVLFSPKLMGVINALVHHRKVFGGSFNLISGMLVEGVFAILIAPLMMCFHAFFVICVLLGFDVKWNAQPRQGRVLSSAESLRYSFPLVIIALVWAGITGYFSPFFLYWLSPVLLGMLAAPLLVRHSSRQFSISSTIGSRVMTTPNEVRPATILTILQRLLSQSSTLPAAEPTQFHMPAEHWHPMPVQILQRSHRRPTHHHCPTIAPLSPDKNR